MKSETNQGYEVQVRVGAVTCESYLFFCREAGDLLLEPGDEVILVAKHNQRSDGLAHSCIGDSTFFERVKNVFARTRVLGRMTGKDSEDSWMTLKEAINEARSSNVH